MASNAVVAAGTRIVIEAAYRDWTIDADDTPIDRQLAAVLGVDMVRYETNGRTVRFLHGVPQIEPPLVVATATTAHAVPSKWRLLLLVDRTVDEAHVRTLVAEHNVVEVLHGEYGMPLDELPRDIEDDYLSATERDHRAALAALLGHARFEEGDVPSLVAAARRRMLCRACEAPVTHAVVEAPMPGTSCDGVSHGEAWIGLGLWSVGPRLSPETMRPVEGESRARFLVNLEDVLESTSVDEQLTSRSCCGSGPKGLNVKCPNGHAVGEHWSHHWIRNHVALDPSRVTIARAP